MISSNNRSGSRWVSTDELPRRWGSTDEEADIQAFQHVQDGILMLDPAEDPEVPLPDIDMQIIGRVKHMNGYVSISSVYIQCIYPVIYI